MRFIQIDNFFPADEEDDDLYMLDLCSKHSRVHKKLIEVEKEPDDFFGSCAIVGCFKNGARRVKVPKEITNLFKDRFGDDL